MNYATARDLGRPASLRLVKVVRGQTVELTGEELDTICYILNCPATPPWGVLLTELRELRKEVKAMTTSDTNLVNEVTALTGAVQSLLNDLKAEETGIAAIIAQLENGSAADDPTVDEAVTNLQTLQGQLSDADTAVQQATANINAALNPNATSTPQTSGTPAAPAAANNPALSEPPPAAAPGSTQ